MRNKIIVGVVIIALIGTIAGFQINIKNKKQIITVKTSKVLMGDVKRYLSTTGTIEAKTEKDYSVSATAKISNVNVKVGDKIKNGGILLTYDTTDLSFQVTSAQINYNNAISQRQDSFNKNNDAKDTIASTGDTQANASTITTAKQSLLSDEKIKQLDYAVESAKVNLDSAKSKLSQNSSITSNIDGVVTAVNVTSGQTGSQETAIVVQDISSLKAIVKVGKYDAANVAVGQESTISSNGKTYKAKVSNIYPTATVSTSSAGGATTLTIELTVLEAAPMLKVNFDADADILLSQALNVMEVPTETILTNKDGSAYLFVTQNGKAIQKTVKLGAQSDSDAQIISGIKVNDSVILNPGTTVQNGVLIKEAAAIGGK